MLNQQKLRYCHQTNRESDENPTKVQYMSTGVYSHVTVEYCPFCAINVYSLIQNDAFV